MIVARADGTSSTRARFRKSRMDNEDSRTCGSVTYARLDHAGKRPRGYKTRPGGMDMDVAPAWTAEEIRRVGHQAVDLVAEYLIAVPDAPVFRPVPREMATELLATPAPRQPQSPDEILAEFRQKVAPYPFGNGHPRFWGWVNSPPSAMGIFAELLAAAMNPSCAGGNHAAVYIERQVLGWFKSMVGFPNE